ncbi:MAG: LPXTG cell wall anchor domain-containing protein, partial [Oscillospiraceae bacterium]|nr:LPXTG cell wall anchor domain-containing protein [Oscillospiraceae bacterium]
MASYGIYSDFGFRHLDQYTIGGLLRQPLRYCLFRSPQHSWGFKHFNKSSLFGVSSGTGYNYNAEDAAAIVDCITQIVKNVVLQANLKGQVTDVIDSAFYPVTSDGTPLADGDWITLNGEKVAAENKNAAGQVKYDSGSNIWSVCWKDQQFDWPTKDSAGNITGSGWKGVLYVKAKENFLGGNAISTNAAGSEIKAEKYISRTGSEMNLTDEHSTDLLTPHVNVDELALTEANTEWTVYLGTEVNPKDQLKKLLRGIDIRKVVSGDTNEMITSKDQMLAGTSVSSKTMKLTEYLGLDTDDKINALITELLSSGSKTFQYNSSTMTTAYGHGYVGDIVVSLENTTGCYSKDNHATEEVGTDAEFTLKVEYIPKDQATRNVELSITDGDYHTTAGGSAGDATGTMTSVNTHKIIVFAKSIQLTKTDESFNNVLTGAKFALYRTARSEETGSTLSGVEGSYVKVEDLDCSANGVVTKQFKISEKLNENEKYYIVESKSPDGYNMLTYPIEVTFSISDSYTPVSPDGDTTTTRPATGLYNWVETAVLSLDVSSGVKRTDAGGTVELTHSGIDKDSETVTMYYRIMNNPGYELPATGGPGTRLFTILGSILILGSGALLWRRRRLI